MMIKVYLLEHLMIYSDYEDTKFIGVFSSREKVKHAVNSLGKRPGFSKAPNIVNPLKDGHVSGFIMDEWTIDKITWQDGFGQ